jgi:photosystem II stability/assembly factor-like uncharacterized protein
MKIFVYFFLIFCFVYSESLAQWVQQNLPPVTANYQVMSSIDFSNQVHGITGGFYADLTIQQFNGSIYYTNDGGNNWLQSVVPDSMRLLQKLQIINDSLAYGAGSYNKTSQVSGGYFVESTDGGASWHPKGSFEDSIYVLTRLSFLNEQTGYVVGVYPGSISFSILKTSDGGNNWTYVYPLTNYFRINDIDFFDEQHGIAVGERVTGQGFVIVTSDGGQNWTENDLSDIFVVMTCKYVDVNIILISGYVNSVTDIAFIYKSTDGGNSWSQFRIYPDHGIEGVDEFESSGRILVYGAYMPEFYNIPFFDISFDGGETWTYNEYPQYQYYIFTGSKMVNESRWYLSGTENSFPGIVLFTDNSGGVPVELTSFSAVSGRGKVVLSWTTATETNNRGFEVQRNSGNGYEIMGFVQGNGNSTRLHNYSFTDKSVNEGNYSYRLRQVDFDGTSAYSKVVEVLVVNPNLYALGQNYPNPFNPVTTIKYSIPVKGFVSLKVYNLLGQEAAVLVDEEQPAGNYSVEFSASSLSTGVYLYKLTSGSFTDTKKLMLLK